MFWRKFQLDWSYAVGELVIVVVGVLIALGIGQWQQELEDREIELEYADRLRSDLTEDTTRFKDFVKIELAKKARVLKELDRIESAPTSFDPSIVDSTSLYYSTYKALPETQSAAYSELKSTGQLRLIRSAALRVLLEDYYDLHELMSGILADPVGPYREIFAGSMSGTAFLDWRVNDIEVPESELIAALRTMLSHPDFKSAVNAELYYTASMTYWLREVLLRGEALLQQLESEYPKSD